MCPHVWMFFAACATTEGEFGQEQRLLGPDYTVYECRAALQNLGSSSLAGAAYASAMRALLGVRCGVGLSYCPLVSCMLYVDYGGQVDSE